MASERVPGKHGETCSRCGLWAKYGDGWHETWRGCVTALCARVAELEADIAVLKKHWPTPIRDVFKELAHPWKTLDTQAATIELLAGRVCAECIDLGVEPCSAKPACVTCGADILKDGSDV